MNLDISASNIGELVLPKGWSFDEFDNLYYGPDGEEQEEPPEGLKPEGVMALADGIKNSGTIMTVNVMANGIGKEQLSKLQEMMQAHETLVSLCGITDDATVANLSGLGMDPDDAVVLADELPVKGALTSLNVSNNALCGINEHGYGIYDASGVTVLAESISKHQ